MLGVIHISLWIEKGIWLIKKLLFFLMNSKFKIKLGIKFLIIQNHTFCTVYVKVPRKKHGHAAPPDTVELYSCSAVTAKASSEEGDL